MKPITENRRLPGFARAAIAVGALFIALGSVLPTSLHAQGATNPDYVIASADTIAVAVAGEPELAATQLIDHNDLIRLPMLGEIKLVGLSVRDAEKLVATTYKEREFLRYPDVRIQIVEYAPRFATVFGAVRSPGKVVFPRDKQEMEILDVITQGAGGLSPVAKGDSVVVTRLKPDGSESTTIVDVANLMSGKRKDDKTANFIVRPRDRIFVPERLF